MGTTLTAIPLEDFGALCRRPRPVGIQANVHIGKALLSIQHDIARDRENTPGGPRCYHTPETELYPYIRGALRRVLPGPIVVDSTALLHALAPAGTPPRTDVSIRALTAFNDARLVHKQQRVFIEVKSVFHGERLTDQDIMADLEKLLRCEGAYMAQCFFLLVGLPSELGRRSPTSVLDLEQRQGPLQIMLSSGPSAWLQPCASLIDGDLHIHSWVVSAQNSFGPDVGYYCYYLFQN